jgi:hypothetical protein
MTVDDQIAFGIYLFEYVPEILLNITVNEHSVFLDSKYLSLSPKFKG